MFNSQNYAFDFLYEQAKQSLSIGPSTSLSMDDLDETSDHPKTAGSQIWSEVLPLAPICVLRKPHVADNDLVIGFPARKTRSIGKEGFMIAPLRCMPRPRVPESLIDAIFKEMNSDDPIPAPIIQNFYLEYKPGDAIDTLVQYLPLGSIFCTFFHLEEDLKSSKLLLRGRLFRWNPVIYCKLQEEKKKFKTVQREGTQLMNELIIIKRPDLPNPDALESTYEAAYSAYKELKAVLSKETKMTPLLKQKWIEFETQESLSTGLNNYEQACSCAFNAVMLLHSVYKVNNPQFLWQVRCAIVTKRWVDLLSPETLRTIAERYEQMINQ